ncbi:MAG TPA: N-acetyl-gamma-glutamyl-phosphate reductase [Ruminococcaceae bacterium]|nr:N-acetyl-gamma-glutamyl-phosphate reductase [Oscillospiraceae bacterium]
MIKAGVIGATGYAGAELTRLLSRHEETEITAVGSKTHEGKKLSEIYPAMRGICDAVCISNSDVIELSDVVFACLPHGLSQDIAKACDDAGKLFIDLGADFRLTDEKAYETWYEGEFKYPELHERAVYGLPEIFRDEIREAKLIANPGCYPTAVALGIYPLLKRGLVEPDAIVIDAKSGVTGAGRVPSQTTHFPECNEAFTPYKITEHRHTPEIEQTLSHAAGKRLKITFVPHLLPINRGILATIYLRAKLGINEQALREAYESFYFGEKFVRILNPGETASLRNVRMSNYCDISLHFDRRTGALVVVSVIDNMVKGAAGQAVQNMNIALGLPEGTGLTMIPSLF